MSKTYCECILHHFRGVTKMVINIDSLGFTANAYDDADASLPALLLLLTIEILTSLLHFIHQLLRRRNELQEGPATLFREAGAVGQAEHIGDSYRIERKNLPDVCCYGLRVCCSQIGRKECVPE